MTAVAQQRQRQQQQQQQWQRQRQPAAVVASHPPRQPHGDGGGLLHRYLAEEIGWRATFRVLSVAAPLAILASLNFRTPAEVFGPHSTADAPRDGLPASPPPASRLPPPALCRHALLWVLESLCILMNLFFFPVDTCTETLPNDSPKSLASLAWG